MINRGLSIIEFHISMVMAKKKNNSSEWAFFNQTNFYSNTYFIRKKFTFFSCYILNIRKKWAR